MGFSLNPVSDLNGLGNAIGGVFGNNTAPTSTPNLIGNSAPTLGLLGPSLKQPAINTNFKLTTPQGAAAPNATGGGSVSTGAPSYTAGVNDPSTLAGYDSTIGQINNEIGNLGNQQSVGNANIDTAYNTAFNQLQQAKADNQASYNTSKTQSAQGYSVGKNTVGANAGSSLNSLERLLGAHGAGGSSAALFNAPEAVGQAAASQRAGLDQTFGANNQNLDTNWNNYLTGEKASENDLNSQKVNQQHGLQASIDTNRANLLNSLANLTAQRTAATGGNATQAAQPFLDQANGLLSTATLLGQNVPVLQAAPTTYTAPQLSSYTTNPNALPSAQNPTNAATDAISPYLSLLLGGKKTNLSAA